MKKILFSANTDSFFIKFLIPQLKYYKEKGYEVHVASKNENYDIPYCDKKYDISFARNLSLKNNIKAYKQMKEIFDKNKYDIISCHTPFGGSITRLAFKKYRKIRKTKIIYTAHGFHFYKGAPLINWLIYYPAEKYLASITDSIITITKEDYLLAFKKFKTHVFHVPGIGVDLNKFYKPISEEKKEQLMKSLNINKKDFVAIFAGELNKNKNQIFLIKAMKELVKKHKNIKLLLAGTGVNKKLYEKKIKEYNLENNVLLLGFRNDICDLLKICDVSVSSSYREGLPCNIIEAIASSIPVIATNNRGHRELVNDSNGFLYKVNDKKDFNDKILYYYKLKNKGIKIDNSDIKKYDIKEVLKEIFSIYEK